MKHARKDYNRIQDPALQDPSLLSEGSTPIAEDEPVFLIRAKDKAFLPTILAWAAEANDLGAEPKLVQSVIDWGYEGVRWQAKNGGKTPDAPPETLK